jgi:hypothetical protein
MPIPKPKKNERKLQFINRCMSDSVMTNEYKIAVLLPTRGRTKALSRSLLGLLDQAHDLKNITNPSEYYEVNTDLTKKLFDAFLIIFFKFS